MKLNILYANVAGYADTERAKLLQTFAELGLQSTLRFRPSDPIVKGALSVKTKLKLLAASNAIWWTR